MSTHHTEEYKGHTIGIHYDGCSENPFTDWDHVEDVFLAITTRHGDTIHLDGDLSIDWQQFIQWDIKGDDYLLCPDENCRNCEDFGNCAYRDELAELKWFARSHLYSLVYMYDHSGVAFNTTGFSCPWDSGVVGLVSIPKSKVTEEWPDYNDEASPDDRGHTYLNGLVELMSAWANGEVYGYTIKDADGVDCEQSCWGYFGDDGIKQAITEARGEIAYMVKQEAIAELWEDYDTTS